MKYLCLALIAFSAPLAHAEGFEGCKDLEVTKTNTFKVVNVSGELQRSQKRIQDICGKILPKKLEVVAKNADSCATGATGEVGPGLGNQMKQQVQTQVSALKQRVETACKSMNSTMAESERFCALRASSLGQLKKGIDAQANASGNQTASQQNAANLYGSAVSSYQQTSASAGDAKNKIYDQLPNRDENRGQQQRQGNESASTDDPKTDKVIQNTKSVIGAIARSNKNQAACQKLSANGGQLDEIGSILKNNLWPNGKVAARAMARIEAEDGKKSLQYAKMKAEADSRAQAAAIASQEQEVQEEPRKFAGTAGAEASQAYLKDAPAGTLVPDTATYNTFFPATACTEYRTINGVRTKMYDGWKDKMGACQPTRTQ
jgi:hypothetical protein